MGLYKICDEIILADLDIKIYLKNKIKIKICRIQLPNKRTWHYLILNLELFKKEGIKRMKERKKNLFIRIYGLSIKAQRNMVCSDVINGFNKDKGALTSPRIIRA